MVDITLDNAIWYKLITPSNKRKKSKWKLKFAYMEYRDNTLDNTYIKYKRTNTQN